MTISVEWRPSCRRGVAAGGGSRGGGGGEWWGVARLRQSGWRAEWRVSGQIATKWPRRVVVSDGEWRLSGSGVAIAWRIGGSGASGGEVAAGVAGPVAVRWRRLAQSGDRPVREWQ
ncbi:hypothetical protein CYMTET_53199 [Cymbomonas tetramitiformis]|uniref:Uncharacterized protein n=1 Tax=Cymbomonas tetramitiformis TaxID=36881 RepID=A0AAE0BJ72_9CHLO|nr:hypothetical protein CYMTET_53199 [Cymbomonas tetramitiformis]